jgi:hypothetical protein
MGGILMNGVALLRQLRLAGLSVMEGSGRTMVRVVWPADMLESQRAEIGLLVMTHKDAVMEAIVAERASPWVDTLFNLDDDRIWDGNGTPREGD